jgi:4-amino-4-deoxy-L-arabinose transferase-like glycosyltransferase
MGKIMRFRKPRLVSMVAAGTTVLVLAVTLLASRRVIDALVLIFIVAALTGMYRLRRYARAELLYRHRTEPRSGVAQRTWDRAGQQRIRRRPR